MKDATRTNTNAIAYAANTKEALGTYRLARRDGASEL
jgi:hypothetical protein